MRGSNLRVKINGVAGQGDPTRMKIVSHGSIGRWRVGSGQEGIEISRVGSGQGFSNLTDRVGSGQEAFKIRGPGRVKPNASIFSRVGSGQAREV